MNAPANVYPDHLEASDPLGLALMAVLISAAERQIAQQQATETEAAELLHAASADDRATV